MLESARLRLTIHAVITQVFPDEFHLNTLDQLLSAIARLNPHVNIKAIVIGLMDRLSSYAARESESEPVDDRKKTEEEATAKLLEKLRIVKEIKPEDRHGEEDSKKANGDQTNGDRVEEMTDSSPNKLSTKESESPLEVDGEEKLFSKKNRGISDNVKLYEIFYDQVVNLVSAQRLQIQDTIPLLVSLTNLAL